MSGLSLILVEFGSKCLNLDFLTLLPYCVSFWGIFLNENFKNNILYNFAFDKICRRVNSIGVILSFPLLTPKSTFWGQNVKIFYTPDIKLEDI